MQSTWKITDPSKILSTDTLLVCKESPIFYSVSLILCSERAVSIQAEAFKDNPPNSDNFLFSYSRNLSKLSSLTSMKNDIHWENNVSAVLNVGPHTALHPRKTLWVSYSSSRTCWKHKAELLSIKPVKGSSHTYTSVTVVGISWNV